MKKLFKCSGCGFVYEGEEAPEKCQKCGAPKKKFAELPSEQAEKIYKSDRTNDIHAELITLATKMTELCKEGIDLRLDPACVALFEGAKNEAWIIKQRSKAEIESHISSGKW